MKITGYSWLECDPPWWVGEVGKCLTCGALIELEVGDESRETFSAFTSETGSQRVAFPCPNDGTTVSICKSAPLRTS